LKDIFRVMTELQNKLENLRLEYRKIFNSTANEISELIEDLKPQGLEGNFFDNFVKDSPGYKWQKNVHAFLTEKLKKEISEKNKEIRDIRNKYHCAGCGTCCKFAVSEFSPKELYIKSQNGDKTAEEFIKTFVPYKTLDEARKIFPEYVEMLEKEARGGYYIYHCPKVTEDNRCPDYENRPQICRDFPDNPIAFLPQKCSFSDWKLKSQSVSLKLSAEVEIIQFYMDKIEGLQNR